MTILYSPTAHQSGNSSGFYFEHDSHAPIDAFPVLQTDQIIAINLPPGSTYSFTAPVAPAVTGTLNTIAPSNSYLLEQEQALQISVIESAYVTANTAPIDYMGTTFQADQASQNLIANVMSASGGVLPPGFLWFDIENNGIEMTFADLQGLAGAILTRGQPLFIHKQAKKAAVRAATTTQQVEDITW